MSRVSRSAEAQIENGFNLAEKGAVFSAQVEFIDAFRSVAHALDAASGTQHHSRALNAGLIALQEADDFLPRGAALESDMDLSKPIALHRTPVLKKSDARNLTHLLAIQRYYAYAEEQLARAGECEPTASRALYGLARLQPFLDSGKGDEAQLIAPRTIALHRAALRIDPQNYRAANELGVVLANHGQLEQAREAFLKSLAVCPQPEVLRNLTVVCKALGEDSLAAEAKRNYEAQLGERRKHFPLGAAETGAAPNVKWVEPAKFSRDVDVSGARAPANPARSPMGSKATSAPPATGAAPRTYWFTNLMGRNWPPPPKQPAKTE